MTGVNGIQIATTDPTVTPTDIVFATGNASIINLRLEGRAASAKTGANSFQFSNADTTIPTISVGDTYSGIVKLAAGSYTSPGTNALSVTGTGSMPGYTFCSGMVNSIGVQQTSTGQVSYTSGQVGTGSYSVTFATAHPIENVYISNITGKGVIAVMQNTSPAPTSTTFQVQCYAVGTATPTNGGFNFMVLAS